MKIRYYGHCGTNTGYGRAANEMVEALAAAGAEIEVVPLIPKGGVLDTSHAICRFFTKELTPRPDAIIIHTLPLGIDAVIAKIDVDAIDVPTVAYTTWEALEVPERVANAIKGTDAIWVPSRATQTALHRSGIPSEVVPHAYDDRRDYIYTGERPEAPFSFYWIGAWSGRKNPAALIRAFAGEFEGDERVRLLIQCRGLAREAFIQALAMTGLPQALTQNIRLSYAELSEPQLWSLHAMADVFVTATHGEAWNLPAFEAMLAGRHCIVPAGQGSDEFLEDTTANLYRASQRAPAFLDVRLVQPQPGTPAGAIDFQTMGGDGLTSSCHWQEPDLLELQEAMRQAFEQRERTIRVDYDVSQAFGRAAVGQRAIELLQRIKPHE